MNHNDMSVFDGEWNWPSPRSGKRRTAPDPSFVVRRLPPHVHAHYLTWKHLTVVAEHARDRRAIEQEWELGL